MQILFRIITLILLSQFLGIVFIFLFHNASSIYDPESIELSTDVIAEKGLAIYVASMQFLTILIPAMLFFLLFYRTNMRKRIMADLPKYSIFFPLAAIMLVFSYPLVQFSAVLNQKIPLPKMFSYENALADDITRMLIEINSIPDLLIKIVVVAMIPAIGEELFFRAGIQNELRRLFRSPLPAIIIASIVFSAFHLQFEGFLPRFLLGLILGYVYYWSSSIWVPVLVHFINNSMVLLVAYFNKDIINSLDMEHVPSIPVYLLIISLTGIFLLARSMMGLRQNELEEKRTLQNS